MASKYSQEKSYRIIHATGRLCDGTCSENDCAGLRGNDLQGWSGIRGFAAPVADWRGRSPGSPKARDPGHPQFHFPGLKIETLGTRSLGEWVHSGVDREVHVPAGREAGATFCSTIKTPHAEEAWGARWL
jgi:hypothetical protein